MLKKSMFVFVAALVFSYVWADGSAPEITVYKNASCGCCGNWITHLKDEGFQVEAHDVADVTPYKKKYGVPYEMGSCHTALVEGYVIEGHVPASDIRRLIKERPDIRGLSAPGMPIGSPGMEQGNKKDSFDVIAIGKDGSTSVYSSYQGG